MKIGHYPKLYVVEGDINNVHDDNYMYYDISLGLQIFVTILIVHCYLIHGLMTFIMIIQVTSMYCTSTYV